MQFLRTKNGFTLVQVIFIIVVLGLLGGIMVKMFGVQSRTTTLSHQGIRAYYAAKSALEWGTNKTLSSSNGDCFSNDTYSSQDFFNSTINFQITMNCTNETYTEGDENCTWYRLRAKAEYGDPGDLDYVSRTLTLQLVNSTD